MEGVGAERGGSEREIGDWLICGRDTGAEYAGARLTGAGDDMAGARLIGAGRGVTLPRTGGVYCGAL